VRRLPMVVTLLVLCVVPAMADVSGQQRCLSEHAHNCDALRQPCCPQGWWCPQQRYDCPLMDQCLTRVRNFCRQ